MGGTRRVLAGFVIAAAAVLGTGLSEAGDRPSHPDAARPAQARPPGGAPQPGGGPAGPGGAPANDNRQPRGVQDGNQPGANSGGGIIESNRSYVAEIAIVVILFGGALWAVCKSARRV